MPLTVIGAASNLIVRDGGLPGVVVRLGGGAFGGVAVEADGVVAGAAALDATVAEHAAAAGLGGLEFLCGVPGSVGGAVAMNAGAYGAEVKDVLDWAELATAEGVRRLPAAELAFAYRHAALPPRAVVVRARFRAAPGGDGAAIAARMNAIRAAREASQPVRARTGGSTFKNPPGHKAWELIDAAGCRGMRLGGAHVSEKHCNFLLNTGYATAAELEALGEAVRARVLERSGIGLEWEIKRVGLPAGEAA
jgi:UDP-N-acetylmuramate dehydrogenase